MQRNVKRTLLAGGMIAATGLAAHGAPSGLETRDGGSPEAQELLKEVRKSLKEATSGIDKRFDDMDNALAEKTKGLLSAEAFEERQKEFENGPVKDLMERQDELEKELKRVASGESRKAEDGLHNLGKRWAETEDFKNMVEGRSTTAKMSLRAITNATLTNADGNPILTPIEKIPGITRDPDRPLTVRDLLPTYMTESTKIDFVKEDVFTNAADYQVAEGDAKPESDITFVEAETSVVTIAHWIHMSQQALDDVPMLQSYVGGRMVTGLRQKEEDEIMAGVGGAGKLTGLIPSATAYDAGIDVLLPGSGITEIDKLRRALYQVRRSYYAADGIVLNPLDVAKLEMLKDGDTRYLLVNPFDGGVPRLWGRRLVEADSIAAGTYLVGAFALAAEIWDRQQASVAISTEDRDNFIKNMVTLRAEERLALVIRRPKAFVTGAL